LRLISSSQTSYELLSFGLCLLSRLVRWFDRFRSWRTGSRTWSGSRSLFHLLRCWLSAPPSSRRIVMKRTKAEEIRIHLFVSLSRCLYRRLHLRSYQLPCPRTRPTRHHRYPARSPMYMLYHQFRQSTVPIQRTDCPLQDTLDSPER
jgi:hypothetical protein